jgi:hypothetical protein
MNAADSDKNLIAVDIATCKNANLLHYLTRVFLAGVDWLFMYASMGASLNFPRALSLVPMGL